MMTSLTASRQAASGRAAAPAPAGPRGRRRNWALAVLGGLVVVVCTAGFAVGWAHAGDRQPVLALARPVAAGQVLTAADLTVVRAGISGPVSLVPASQETTVAGRMAAVPLPAGALLVPGDVGLPELPAGQQELGVALKPGQYPPDLSAGQTVDVLSTPAPTAAGSSASSAAALPVGQAVVLAVDPSATAGETVVELRLSQNAVPQVAAVAAAGQISLATIAAGG
jgi:Flp pilus assembly protein CpaB